MAFALRDKDFSFNASLDPMQVLERMGFLPRSIYREGNLIRLHCPIHKDLARKSLLINADEKTYKCQYASCPAHQGGLLVELVALYLGCALDDVPTRLYAESKASRDLVFRGELFINQGRASEALPYFEQACAQNPTDEITRCKMAALYLELNMKDEAYREYLRAAESYAVRGELEKTLSIYNILIMLQPGAVKARKQLAVLFSRLGRPDAAAEQLKWVVDFYLHYGQMKGAVEACDQLIEAAPENAQARRLKGIMLLQMTKRVDGVREFEEAARLFLRQGEREQALATIEEGLKVAPGNPRLRELQAQAEIMAASDKPQITPEETAAAEEAFIAWLRDVDAQLDFQTPAAAAPAPAPSSPAPVAPPPAPPAVPPPAPAAPAAPQPVSKRSQYETAEILPGDIRVSRCLADIADLTTSQVENMREEIIMMFNEARRTYEEGLVSEWELRVIKEFYKAFHVAVEIHRKGENPNPPTGPKPS